MGLDCRDEWYRDGEVQEERNGSCSLYSAAVAKEAVCRSRTTKGYCANGVGSY